ncbi:MAG: AtpZ/AtpI family protein [Oscillospiraceae bacterium]
MQNTNKKIYNSLKYLSLLSQLGISLIVPPLMCILAATWIKNRFGMGDWIVVAGIIFGIGGGITSVYNYLKVAMNDAKKSQQEYEDKFK